MQNATVVLTDPLGLHLVPASKVVQAAARYHSDITLECNSHKASAKSIVTVLGLGARQGAAVEIKASGEDEVEALAAIVELLEQDNQKEEESK